MREKEEHQAGSPDSPGFPKTWRARVLPGAPLIAPARQFTFPQRVPGEEDALQRGALLLEVYPAQASSFLATCALGFRDPALPTGVWPCPSSDHMLAIAGGYAYLLATQEPERTVLLEQRPVTQVLASPEKGMLFLAGFHDVLALGPKGLLWRSSRLSWEGVTLDRVEGNHLHGFGWDMFADAEVPFQIDLQSGQHLGGGYRSSRA